jgi:NfeD-like C-terminal, partner-binding
MSIFWSFLVVAGLLVLVYLMIAGIPNPKGVGVVQRNVHVFLPTIGVLSTAIGIAGYLSQGSTWLSGFARILTIAGVGAAAAIVAAWTVVKVFAAPAHDAEDDPRYRFQGQVAVVTEPIQSDHPGRIVFQVDGQYYDLGAWSLDRTPIAIKSEVVIEQVDDVTAIVELWASVEQRL